MLVLLPPSETKRAGGDGPPLTVGALSFPELDPLRKELLDELVELAGDVPASRAALGLSARQDGEVSRNAELWTSPTLPALHRYTGVLYDALDAGSLRGAAAARARSRLAVGSALFGLLRAGDPVPAYRLSAGSALPGRPTLAARWRPLLDPVLAAIADGETVVDLRSGSYAALGRVPGAVTVDVLSQRPDGSRAVVSHFNKAHKGRLARALAITRAEPGDATGVAAVARRAGLRVERTGPAHLGVVVAAGRPGACTPEGMPAPRRGGAETRLPRHRAPRQTALHRAGARRWSTRGARHVDRRPGRGPPPSPRSARLRPHSFLSFRAAGGHLPSGDPALREHDLDTFTHPTKNRRRRFDDDEPVHRRHHRSAPIDLDGRTGTDIDGPPTGDRWSTWTGAAHGPRPRPPWVVTDHAAVDTELGVLKTGKEADVHLLERAVPGTGRRVLLAAKRYRSAEHRMFHRDAGYTEGRRVRRSRETRAMARRTAFGRDLLSGQWAAAEFAALSRLWADGVAVPYPVQLDGTELLLEFVGAPDGTAAPRLAQLRPDPDELADLWHQLVDALRGLARHGWAHGDLSAYNVLVHRRGKGQRRLVLIDLPQVVDVVGNPQGPGFLARDVARVAEWFTAHGLPRGAARAAELLDDLHVELGIPPAGTIGGTSHP